MFIKGIQRVSSLRRRFMSFCVIAAMRRYILGCQGNIFFDSWTGQWVMTYWRHRMVLYIVCDDMVHFIPPIPYYFLCRQFSQRPELTIPSPTSWTCLNSWCQYNNLYMRFSTTLTHICCSLCSRLGEDFHQKTSSYP